MKKRIICFFTLSLIILFIISSGFTSSQTIQENIENSISDLEKSKNQIDQLPTTPEETKKIATDYLRKEWESVLEKNEFVGPIIRTYKKISPITDPIIKAIVGLKPSLSWFFLLTLVIWISFWVYLNRIIEGFSTFSDIVSLIISLGLTIILSLLGVIIAISNTITKIINLAQLWWVKLILIILIITLFIIASIFSKKIGAVMRLIKKKKKEEKEELNRIKLKLAAERAEKFTKEISESLEDE